MWVVIKTQTGVMDEARNPAHVEVKAYSTRAEALSAFVQEFADTVAALGRSLEYAEIDTENEEARVFGSVEVIVIARRELPEPANGTKEAC